MEQTSFVDARPPFPQHPYQQVPGHFPAVRYQYPPPAQATVSVDIFTYVTKLDMYGVQPPFLVGERVC